MVSLALAGDKLAGVGFVALGKWSLQASSSPPTHSRAGNHPHPGTGAIFPPSDDYQQPEGSWRVARLRCRLPRTTTTTTTTTVGWRWCSLAYGCESGRVNVAAILYSCVLTLRAPTVERDRLPASAASIET
ncbi:hypothetical protein ZHAS_00020467 [Anopheles sinensis]|uniref:Uncharacterized protein n=1 Tax=Anopheles sinensis TaxID=74873 RepID=A0A084WPJ8_ANOSI|nr:hypothetical protein ZHAS_00020467 [Anopheles sinensis]